MLELIYIGKQTEVINTVSLKPIFYCETDIRGNKLPCNDGYFYITYGKFRNLHNNIRF